MCLWASRPLALIIIVFGCFIARNSAIKLRARGHGVFKHNLFLSALLEELILRHIRLNHGILRLPLTDTLRYLNLLGWRESIRNYLSLMRGCHLLLLNSACPFLIWLAPPLILSLLLLLLLLLNETDLLLEGGSLPLRFLLDWHGLCRLLDLFRLQFLLYDLRTQTEILKKFLLFLLESVAARTFGDFLACCQLRLFVCLSFLQDST